MSLRFRKGCHLTSSCRFSRDISFVAHSCCCASFCILCSSCFSYLVQLSQTTSEYSRKGSNKSSAYDCKRFLAKFESKSSRHILLIRPNALWVMYFMCLCHVQSADKIKP